MGSRTFVIVASIALIFAVGAFGVGESAISDQSPFKWTMESTVNLVDRTFNTTFSSFSLGNKASTSLYQVFSMLPNITQYLWTALTVLAVSPFVFVGFLVLMADLKSREDHQHIPKHLPWVAKRDELFSSLRANIRGFLNSKNLYQEGYDKYSKNGKPFVVPTWTRGPQVILPQSYAPWIAAQPDGDVHAKDFSLDNIQFPYTIGHMNIVNHNMMELLIKRELTRTVGLLNSDIVEEISTACEQAFGDGEWVECNVADTLGNVVARGSTRTFVGKELCSNPEYIRAAAMFTRAVIAGSYALHTVTRWMRPVIGWFVTIPNRHYRNISMKYLVPLVKARREEMEAARNNPNSGYEPPEDVITWMLRESATRPHEDQKLFTDWALAFRVVFTQFAAINTTTITVVNSILDIFSTPKDAGLVEELREEAERVLQEHGGQWTKVALSKLHKLDSVIRESSRINGLFGTSLGRKVRSESGITVPGMNGEPDLWLPKGTVFGVSMRGIHFDKDNYDDPFTFDPFRFSRPRDAPDGKKINEDLLTTSDKYLLFGNGVHVCPGRFYAVQNVKLTVVHILLNYDIELERTPNRWLGDISVIPESARMRIRKRIDKV